SELTSPSSFYSKASKPGSALTLTGLALRTLQIAAFRPQFYVHNLWAKLRNLNYIICVTIEDKSSVLVKSE
ncbi:hypothetical protein QUA13_21315, partial [Microcoleus sp. S28C3]|uniref:hypothetical protein n=1 Tax=Microcoleus sp. S28C3 TaxID=3055414 RepID=UPI002FD08E6C